MPTPTDLVTSLPADFEVFGQAVDSSMADLKGGTTGQVLSKNSNTDMDFVWVTDAAGDITGVTAGTGISGGGTSGTVTITNSMATAIDAKGDLVVGTGADTFSRLAVGTNDYFLQAASGEATGLKWGGTWTAYTPTVLQSGAVTVTVGNARYIKVGKLVVVQGLLVVTGTGTASNLIKITCPVTPYYATSLMPCGTGTVYDSSTANVYPSLIAFLDTTYFAFTLTNAITTNGSQYLGASQFTAALAANDQIGFTFTYEAG